MGGDLALIEPPPDLDDILDPGLVTDDFLEPTLFLLLSLFGF